jgi:hypothetical protein
VSLNCNGKLDLVSSRFVAQDSSKVFDFDWQIGGNLRRKDGLSAPRCDCRELGRLRILDAQRSTSLRGVKINEERTYSSFFDERVGITPALVACSQTFRVRPSNPSNRNLPEAFSLLQEIWLKHR